jgi:hypothetical protein
VRASYPANPVAANSQPRNTGTKQGAIRSAGAGRLGACGAPDQPNRQRTPRAQIKIARELGRARFRGLGSEAGDAARHSMTREVRSTTKPRDGAQVAPTPNAGRATTKNGKLRVRGIGPGAGLLQERATRQPDGRKLAAAQRGAVDEGPPPRAGHYTPKQGPC